MAEVLAGPSGLTRQHLPTATLAEIGYYLKVDANGNPIWYYETPSGTITEAGVAAANDIGVATGTTTSAKIIDVISDDVEEFIASIRLEIECGRPDSEYAEILEAGSPVAYYAITYTGGNVNGN